MSQNINSQFSVLNTINQVDGFDPSHLTGRLCRPHDAGKAKAAARHGAACVVPSAAPRRENRTAG